MHHAGEEMIFATREKQKPMENRDFAQISFGGT
jgi:hypothetical protein